MLKEGEAMEVAVVGLGYLPEACRTGPGWLVSPAPSATGAGAAITVAGNLPSGRAERA